MIYCMGCMEEIEEGEIRCPHCGYEVNHPDTPGILPAGTVLQGRYIVGKSIGNGGFGVTYIGLDGQLKRKIAIKEFFPHKITVRMADRVSVAGCSEENAKRFQMGLEQFLNEAKHLARLSHIQGIVYIYNYFYENGTGYIIMEYLEGMDLRDLLEERGGSIPYEEARELILSVLYILRNVHMNGILHRDIAPDNVFVTDDGIVKLIDLGAAKHATRGSEDSAEILLKVGYAPVEQYSLDGKQGSWTDMYEVGALFYRMITGIKPVASVERRKKDTLVIPSDLGILLPPEAEAAIMTSLNVESRYRIQNARDFMEALGGREFRPTEWTVESTVLEEMPEEVTRFLTPKKIALIAGICVLILAGGVVTALRLRDGKSVVVTNYLTLPAIEEGKSYEEIERELTTKGFSVSKEEMFSETIASGGVIGYRDHQEGESVQQSEPVVLLVSQGKSL